MSTTPESRRDAVVAQIIAAGGILGGTIPLATAADPHTVVAYRILAGSDEADVLEVLTQIRADTEVDLTGLVPWISDVSEEVLDA